MKEITGNLWDHHPEYIIAITTNGIIKKNGECVMGRGCAKEAKDRFPDIAKKLGTHVKLCGNHVYYLGKNVVSFPTKYGWWEDSDISLIERSTQELVALVDKSGWKSVIIPRPGCNNGRLKWSKVKPVLKKYLDNRFTVISFGSKVGTSRMNSITSFKNEFEFLSNFYTSPFVYAGYCWPTVEHAFQAAKTKFSTDKWLVRIAKTPGIAKKKGRRIALRENWEQVKVSVMTELVWLKFEYNPTLKNKLLDTKDAELIEGNYWHDNFWGDCFCKKCSDQKGKNMLGYILMQVRKEEMNKC